MLDNDIDETLYIGQTIEPAEDKDNTAKGDLQRLFSLMPTQRYVFIIQRLVLEDQEPEQLAKEMGVTVENLYNIKRRAMAQLTQVALNDIREYEK